MKGRGLQQGRGNAAQKAPKDFKKAEKGYKEVFDLNEPKVNAEDKKYKKVYSRVTHKQVSKATQGKPL